MQWYKIKERFTENNIGGLGSEPLSSHPLHSIMQWMTHKIRLTTLPRNRKHYSCGFNICVLSVLFCTAGDSGPKGDKGDKGEDGVGIKGSPGAPGAPGKAPFLS